MDAFATQVERDLFVFDWVKPLGTIDDGSDINTRRHRAEQAALQLNGAGGETYREVWNLGDRRVGLEKFVRMRFDRGWYDFMRPPFDAHAYFDRFTEKVQAMLGIDPSWIPRARPKYCFHSWQCVRDGQ